MFLFFSHVCIMKQLLYISWFSIEFSMLSCLTNLEIIKRFEWAIFYSTINKCIHLCHMLISDVFHSCSGSDTEEPEGHNAKKQQECSESGQFSLHSSSHCVHCVLWDRPHSAKKYRDHLYLVWCWWHIHFGIWEDRQRHGAVHWQFLLLCKWPAHQLRHHIQHDAHLPHLDPVQRPCGSVLWRPLSSQNLRSLSGLHLAEWGNPPACWKRVKLGQCGWSEYGWLHVQFPIVGLCHALLRAVCPHLWCQGKRHWLGSSLLDYPRQLHADRQHSRL